MTPEERQQQKVEALRQLEAMHSGRELTNPFPATADAWRLEQLTRGTLLAVQTIYDRLDFLALELERVKALTALEVAKQQTTEESVLVVLNTLETIQQTMQLMDRRIDLRTIGGAK